MNLKAGLVGLPNVGKSTLFNAITNAGVPAENYPFCTISPHTSSTAVPDIRLEKLKSLFNSGKIIPVLAEFVDIAGLVKGAASGEGLGNQFLSHIREVSLIINVLRCFEDENITHTNTTVDPLRDFDIIQIELAFKDIESMNVRLTKIGQLLKKPLVQGERESFLEEESLLKKMIILLSDGKIEETKLIARIELIGHLNLLILKNFLVVANIGEEEISNPDSNKWIQKLYNFFGKNKVLPINAKIESELSLMDKEDSIIYQKELGITESGLSVIVRRTYEELGLMTFFTCGPKEIHAWQIKKDTAIKKAAGEIHSDLERGFICAQVFSYDDIVMYGSEIELKNKGKIKTVGSDYIVMDGDIVHIQFNV